MLPALAGCGASRSPSAKGPGASGAMPRGSVGDPVVATADVPVGGGVVNANLQVVVTQPSEGEFKAFSSICTHQGCPVNEIRGDEIVCPCHFSKFSIADGSVVGGPAPEPLPAVDVHVEGDDVVLG